MHITLGHSTPTGLIIPLLKFTLKYLLFAALYFLCTWLTQK
jgi:hypothetical protein